MNEKSRPLRVLHLASHTGIAAGGSWEMMRMAQAFQARGHHVECAFHWRPGKTGEGERNFDQLTTLGIECTAFRMENFLSIVLGDRRRFRNFIKNRDFDIVHCHKPRALRFALRALGGTKKPAIVTHRGNSYQLTDHDRHFYGDPRVRAVICVAEELRVLAIQGGLKSERVFTNYTGVELADFDFALDAAPVRAELGIEKEAPVVGIVANFEGKKAHGEFFQAASLVAREMPQTRFLVVGRGAPAELPETLKNLGIEKNVVLAGFRTDVPRMLAAMDVSVNSSTRGEGLTGAMRESLAMKRAVVCTDIGGNKELVKDGETGLLVPPRDAAAMSAAILSLLRNRARATQMGEAGYALVREKFSLDAMARGLETIYHAAISCSPE